MNVALSKMSDPEEADFFTEADIDADDGKAARRHLAAGRAIYIAQSNYPGRAIRVHPDGRRELMRLNDKGQLVVDGPANPPLERDDML